MLPSIRLVGHSLLSIPALLVVLLALGGCEIVDGSDADIAPQSDASTDTNTAADSQQDGTPSCASDGFCDPACNNDPDCGTCQCDNAVDVCNVSAPESTTDCTCDPDCVDRFNCDEDGYCDEDCPASTDPDCDVPCTCAAVDGICVASGPESEARCECDADCVGGAIACDDDGYCDANCPQYADTDCDCACDSLTVCNAEFSDGTACSCDPECDGGSACVADGECDPVCEAGLDPDCDGCICDLVVDICEAAEVDSLVACDCDADCVGIDPCLDDDYCDTFCPTGEDPNCCACDYYPDICEADANGSLTECACDTDCDGGGLACENDGHCDTWCDPNDLCDDPDCNGFAEAVCERP